MGGSAPGFFDNFFWVMAGLGGVGACIDFLLGKPGQKKLRNWLETWWYQFNEVRWRNFGKAEAELVVRLLDRYAGSRLWSLRRWIAAAGIVSAGVVFGLLTVVYVVAVGNEEDQYLGFVLSDWVLHYVILVVSVAISLSFMRALSKFAAFASRSAFSTILAFLFLLAVHIAVFAIWTPTVGLVRTLVALQIENLGSGIMLPKDIEFIKHSDDVVVLAIQFWGGKEDIADRYLHSVFFDVHGPFTTLRLRFVNEAFWAEPYGGHVSPAVIGRFGAQLFVDIAVNVVRIVFAIIFLLSFVLRPLLQAPLSLIWARVIESESPIASCVLGGIATLAKVVQEVTKRFL